jgi:hypothetical protein
MNLLLSIRLLFLTSSRPTQHQIRVQPDAIQKSVVMLHSAAFLVRLTEVICQRQQHFHH